MNEPLRAADAARALSDALDDQAGPHVVPVPTDDWPDPQPLPDELPPVLPFDYALLPTSFRDWIADIAERMQCPPDFPAVAAMIVLATVVGRKVGIRPKRQDDWLVVPNLWGAVIGPPSVMKSPAIEEPMKPLKRLEIEAKEQFSLAVFEYEAQELVAEQRKQLAKKAIKAQLEEENGDPLESARAALRRDDRKPVRRRYIVNDSTVEKLGVTLNENPNGILYYRDELIGFLKSLDKDGYECARAFFLEAWDGDGRSSQDRIGRGTIDIESVTVSIIGSIQPGPLRTYICAAIRGGEGADGLMQRFQLAVYPDISKEWRNVDRWPDTAAKQLAYNVIRELDHLDPTIVGAECDDKDPDGIPYLRFEPAAQSRFDEWREKLELHLRSEQDHPAIVAHLAKYRSLIPSLALLIHLADGHTGPVGLESLDRAIGWGRYLESHARRIYAAAVRPDIMEAAALAKKILSRELPDEFALRDIYRKGWVGLDTRDAADRAVSGLLDFDWLDVVTEPTQGRTRTRYRINPKLRADPSFQADKTDKSPPPYPPDPLLSALSAPPEGESPCA